MIHLDTSFVVDLVREATRDDHGDAHRFLERHADSPLAISLHAICELEAGVACSGNPQRESRRLEAVVRALPTAQPGEGFARMYGERYGELRIRGELVSSMDLLIATAARVHEADLVTRNIREFERIPGSRVLSY